MANAGIEAYSGLRNESLTVTGCVERDLLEIPPSELFVVFSQLDSPDDESLTRSVLEHYGFPRLTEKRRRYFIKVLKTWRANAKHPKKMHQGILACHPFQIDPPPFPGRRQWQAQVFSL